MIRQEAVDVEGGVIAALQTLGIVNAEGQVNLDVSDSVLLTLQNAGIVDAEGNACLLYTSPSPRDRTRSRMPSSA